MSAPLPELPRTPSFRLDGRRALVTGAGRGIGLGAAAAASFARLYLLPAKRKALPPQVRLAPSW